MVYGFSEYAAARPLARDGLLTQLILSHLFFEETLRAERQRHRSAAQLRSFVVQRKCRKSWSSVLRYSDTLGKPRINR